MILYVGAFVDSRELVEKLEKNGVERNILFRPVQKPHVTFQYRPKEIDESLLGEKVNIRVVGYGCDGENEGVAVELTCENEKVRKLSEKVKIPHITLSVSEDGRPANTRYLGFTPIERPFVVEGIYLAIRK